MIFKCPKCHKLLIDTFRSVVSECEHYPMNPEIDDLDVEKLWVAIHQLRAEVVELSDSLRLLHHKLYQALDE